MDKENESDKGKGTEVIVEENELSIPAMPKEDFYVAGMGASAGGLEALEQFFANMPPVDNLAFVVIQHLSPDYKSFMPELLSKHTKMKVYQIQNGMQLGPGCIYLNPPKYNVAVSEGRFLLVDQDPVQRINLAIDTFLESLAVSMKERSIAIILSGTGSDGTRGCRAIKEVGGIVMAQDETSAKFNGMPKSVISTNICDYIMAPRFMPDELLKYTGQPSLIEMKVVEKPEDVEGSDTLAIIYNIIKKRYSIDFNLYKQSTVLRCIDRRMRINQLQDPILYLELMKDNPGEVERLYNSLLIGVTRFFRDGEAFNVIKNKVIPEIFGSKPDNSSIRVWVAGCSTGEEAYSLAILFKEYMDTAQRNFNIKIFATDIDNNAIEYASEGVYPDSISCDVSLERLNRYFIKKKDTYQVSKTIREMVIFSFHNVISNPPFFRIDLLSCRNLLIYFQPVLQTRILSTFQFALETNGYMFLGTSETTGELGGYFSSVDAKWKIFKGRETKKRPLIDDISIISSGMKVVTPKIHDDYFTRRVRNSWEMDDIYAKLIEECLPPSVVVDENGELVQVCGDADRFLKVPRGRVFYDIQKMVPKELSTALGTALNKVKKEKKTVTYTNIKVMLGEGVVCINLIVKPLLTKKNGALALVVFEEIKSSITQGEYIENYDTVSKLHERIADLEQELQYTKESLQTSIEEIETSSEEIQSANEELLVSNEELHSTNEELQSVNQELIVVNTQYQYKIQELAELNNDMTNFLNSTTIGTIFLDANLYVRKFTPAVTREINLIESDIGRPISHISYSLINEDLTEQARNVMSSLVPSEREVRSTNNKWYLLKYAPYRTNENIIKGVVISLVDITARKEAEEDLKRSKDRYEKLVELSPFAVFILKGDIIQFSNTEGSNLLQVKRVEQLIGKSIGKYLDISEAQLVNMQQQYLQDQDNRAMPMEDKIIRADGSVIYVEIMSMPIYFEEESAQLVILRDITFRKLSEQLQEDNTRAKRLLEEAKVFDGMKNDFFSNLSHELRTPLNVIMSTLQFLESMMKDNSQKGTGTNIKKYTGIMKQNCFRQLRLINNLIDITKIDAGFFEVRLQNNDIVKVIEDITLSVSEYIKNKSIELVFDTDVEEKITAFDPDKIERIMLNLLSNAVKFTGEGGSISVSMFDKGDSIQISVRDSGTGIPEEKLDVIFERFRQVDKSLNRAQEGSGIGLSLVKSIVEMHGGKIYVQSEYGAGSEFVIELPVKTVPEDEVYIDEDNKQQSNVEKIHLEFSDIYNLN
ncbi:MAG TPA: chemotaxis protein CheB [Clostridia bacterium]|nr:chemotaxis protein CheB [Clostridia bacterium]